ncbi:amino acid ABC transporter permease [Pseudolysinimonas sp.]|jgi:glutamate transport system permease protein|uniref:amino acid ABC transporter permease n=1 Tax=Pseudolysinimonas sp. TaxID=2680009 RepID=UPI0037839785
MSAIIENLDVLISGFLLTLALLGIAGVGALALGAVVAGLRVSPIAPLRGIAVGYTEIFRNTPLTLVLLGSAFVLPFLGVRFPGLSPQQFYFVLAAIGLTLYTAPFIAEAIRSGINSIPVGQAEAARSIGLTFGQTLTLVILPQAIRVVIPPIINVLIALTKNTSVAGGFFVVEMFASGRLLIERTAAAVPILLAIAALYLVITVTLGLLAGVVEKKVAVLR